MKQFLLVVSFLLSRCIYAQSENFTIHSIKLPAALAEPENQFSGLQIAGSKLYLLPECRIQEPGHTARLYTINLSEIDRQLKDSSYHITYDEINIFGLYKIRDLIAKQGQQFEGLEAFIINGKTIYFSVEPTTESTECFLLKGKMIEGNIYLDEQLTIIKKPTMKDGSLIYNASFEAIGLTKKKLYSFYEYNYFDKNYVPVYNRKLASSSRDSAFIEALPFRITDITPVGNHHYTAINFFYKGADKNRVYRVPPADSIAYGHIYSNGVYNDYCSLVDIEYRNNQFNWKTIWEFPKNYTGYNWEGIAAYKNGYFVINDKYTLKKPYSSVLIYLQKKPEK